MKKKAAIGLSLLVGVALLATTAFASGSGLNGYDLYKQAFQNTRAATSLTATAAVTISDNGNVLLKSNAVVKADHQSKDLSAAVNLTSGSQSDQLLAYRQNGQIITKLADNPVYNILSFQPGNSPWSKQWNRQHSQSSAGGVQNIIDLLAGNFQNYISTSSTANGDKQVSLALSGNQIPSLANAVASMVVRQGALHMAQLQNPVCPVQAAVAAQFPQLINGIEISNVGLKADIDPNNVIKEQTANVTISGKDAQGKTHQLVLNLAVTFSNLNNTTPDSVNLSGKQVKTVQAKAWAAVHSR